MNNIEQFISKHKLSMTVRPCLAPDFFHLGPDFGEPELGHFEYSIRFGETVGEFYAFMEGPGGKSAEVIVLEDTDDQRSTIPNVLTMIGQWDRDATDGFRYYPKLRPDDRRSEYYQHHCAYMKSAVGVFMELFGLELWGEFMAAWKIDMEGPFECVIDEFLQPPPDPTATSGTATLPGGTQMTWQITTDTGTF